MSITRDCLNPTKCVAGITPGVSSSELDSIPEGIIAHPAIPPCKMENCALAAVEMLCIASEEMSKNGTACELGDRVKRLTRADTVKDLLSTCHLAPTGVCPHPTRLEDVLASPPIAARLRNPKKTTYDWLDGSSLQSFLAGSISQTDCSPFIPASSSCAGTGFTIRKSLINQMLVQRGPKVITLIHINNPCPARRPPRNIYITFDAASTLISSLISPLSPCTTVETSIEVLVGRLNEIFDVPKDLEAQELAMLGTPFVFTRFSHRLPPPEEPPAKVCLRNYQDEQQSRDLEPKQQTNQYPCQKRNCSANSPSPPPSGVNKVTESVPASQIELSSLRQRFDNLGKDVTEKLTANAQEMNNALATILERLTTIKGERADVVLLMKTLMQTVSKGVGLMEKERGKTDATISDLKCGVAESLKNQVDKILELENRWQEERKVWAQEKDDMKMEIESLKISLAGAEMGSQNWDVRGVLTGLQASSEEIKLKLENAIRDKSKRTAGMDLRINELEWRLREEERAHLMTQGELQEARHEKQREIRGRTWRRNMDGSRTRDGAPVQSTLVSGLVSPRVSSPPRTMTPVLGLQVVPEKGIGVSQEANRLEESAKMVNRVGNLTPSSGTVQRDRPCSPMSGFSELGDDDLDVIDGDDFIFTE